MTPRLVLEGARIALLAIRANKLRSFLTLLANVVSVASVIAVVSILSGMDVFVKERVAKEGSGVFTVTRVDELLILSSLEGFLESLRNPPLTLDDALALARSLTLARAVGAEVSTRATLEAERLSVDGASVRGVTEAYVDVRDLPLGAGRHLAASEVRRAAPVAVVGSDVALKLFPGLDPLDRDVRVRGRHFRIVGVVERRGAILGQSQDLFALVPMGCYQRMFGYRQSVTIAVRVNDLAQMDRARDEATVLMRIRHRLRPGKKSDFAVVSSDSLIGLWRRISGSIFLSLTGISAISLVIGGIIIMNIMLVSVTERTREIGVRMALGARRQTILWQFLVEAMTFSAAGGMLGILAGFVVASLVAALTPLPYAVKSWAILAGLLVTAATGLGFGIYPASVASRLDPIEALRWE